VYAIVIRVALGNHQWSAFFVLRDLPRTHSWKVYVEFGRHFLEEFIAAGVAVSGVELLKVVFRREEAKSLERHGPLMPVKCQAYRFRQTIRRGEDQLDGVIVDLLKLHRLAADVPFGVNRRGDVRVSLDGFPPEDHVVNRKGHTIRPA